MKVIIRDEWPRDMEQADVDIDAVFDPDRIAEALRPPGTGGVVIDARPAAEVRCHPINDELEIHYWPTPDPPVGTSCECGKAQRRPPRWEAS